MSQQQLLPAKTDIGILNLAGELRNKIYELLLVVEHPVNPWAWPEWERHVTSSLLLANKTIHDEARSVLYGQNSFDFAKATSEETASFLEKIGKVNAGCIRHVVISFPGFSSLEPSEITLENDSITILSTIQRSCVNLSTLTTSLASTDFVEQQLDNQSSLQVVEKALALVDDHFQALRSVTQVVLEVFENGPSNEVRSVMKSYGWKIRVMEIYEDDWDERFSDVYQLDDEYDDDGMSGDEYDIDNDSDFWRRAAD